MIKLSLQNNNVASNPELRSNIGSNDVIRGKLKEEKYSPRSTRRHGGETEKSVDLIRDWRLKLNQQPVWRGSGFGCNSELRRDMEDEVYD